MCSPYKKVQITMKKKLLQKSFEKIFQSPLSILSDPRWSTTVHILSPIADSGIPVFY
jgi:hypothetical protein